MNPEFSGNKEIKELKEFLILAIDRVKFLYETVKEEVNKNSNNNFNNLPTNLKNKFILLIAKQGFLLGVITAHLRGEDIKQSTEELRENINAKIQKFDEECQNLLNELKELKSNK